MPKIRDIAGNERGTTTLEYALIVGMVALAIVGGLTAIGAKGTDSLLRAARPFHESAYTSPGSGAPLPGEGGYEGSIPGQSGGGQSNAGSAPNTPPSKGGSPDGHFDNDGGGFTPLPEEEVPQP